MNSFLELLVPVPDWWESGLLDTDKDKVLLEDIIELLSSLIEEKKDKDCFFKLLLLQLENVFKLDEQDSEESFALELQHDDGQEEEKMEGALLLR